MPSFNFKCTNETCSSNNRIFTEILDKLELDKQKCKFCGSRVFLVPSTPFYLSSSVSPEEDVREDLELRAQNHFDKKESEAAIEKMKKFREFQQNQM